MIRQLNSIDSYELAIARPGAFTGGSGERGDKDTAGGLTTLFEVTGDVFVRVFGVCTVDVASSSGTIEIGVTGNTAGIIAQTTGTDIDASDIWYAAAPADVGVKAFSSVPGPLLIVNGLDITEKIATADFTAGNIYYVCLWAPASPGSKVRSLY